MRKVRVCIELDEETFGLYEAEARRSGTSVEAMVEKVVQGLFEELKQEESEGDHPIFLP